MTNGLELLRIQDLQVAFHRGKGFEPTSSISVLKGVSLTGFTGEVLAVIGESGAGKSILAHALLGLLPRNAELSGTITYRGEPLNARRLEQLRGREIALVPQSVGFLDPLLKAKHAVRLAARRAGKGRAESIAAQERAFEQLGLSSVAGEAYPFELSGGMARRVLLAMALVGNAKLLIADEPTPGLDPESVQESMKLLKALATEGRSILLISHDIVAALTIAHRVAVLVDGTIVEVALASAFCGAGGQLVHPYSRALWNALPDNAFIAPSSPPRSGTGFHPPTDRAADLPYERGLNDAEELHA